MSAQLAPSLAPSILAAIAHTYGLRPVAYAPPAPVKARRAPRAKAPKRAPIVAVDIASVVSPEPLLASLKALEAARRAKASDATIANLARNATRDARELAEPTRDAIAFLASGARTLAHDANAWTKATKARGAENMRARLARSAPLNDAAPPAPAPRLTLAPAPLVGASLASIAPRLRGLAAGSSIAFVSAAGDVCLVSVARVRKVLALAACKGARWSVSLDTHLDPNGPDGKPHKGADGKPAPRAVRCPTLAIHYGATGRIRLWPTTKEAAAPVGVTVRAE